MGGPSCGSTSGLCLDNPPSFLLIDPSFNIRLTDFLPKNLTLFENQQKKYLNNLHIFPTSTSPASILLLLAAHSTQSQPHSAFLPHNQCFPFPLYFKPTSNKCIWTKVFTKNIYYITAHTGNNVLHYKYNNCKSTWEEVSNLAEHTGFIFWLRTHPQISEDTSS